MRKFHHEKLPVYSALLSGRIPSDVVSFRSDDLQIWYNNQKHSWLNESEKLHLHTQSDELFLVLKGALIVEANGQQYRIGPREFCCFPKGLPHAILTIEAPVETLMIRAPSVDDKVYQE